VNLALLSDPLLLLIMAMAGFVSMCTSLQVATRPAAVFTGHVSTALTMGQLVFIVTRFGNMFYLPLLGNFVDDATRSGDTTTLIEQVKWVIVGSAGGAIVAFLFLPSFVELCCRGVLSVYHRGMVKALINLVVSRRAWKSALGSLSRPSMMGTRLFKLEGVPKAFLLANILASAIWTVGALAAITVSGLNPEFKQTALLLSGLVNSFAAIAFSIWVDPQAAVVTDQAKKLERPHRHVTIAAFHLVFGNFIGCLLGLWVLAPAIKMITWATLTIGHSATQMDAAMGYLIAGNALILLLTGTIYSSRVSAVRTASMASAMAIFNFFGLIARVGSQVYAPFVGAVTDQLTHRPADTALDAASLAKLEFFYRGLIGGATAGCLLSVLLIPTFVRVYQVMIVSLNQEQSLPAVLLRGLNPSNWVKILRLFTAPWKQAVSRQALARIPKAFLWANVLVLAFMTVGQLAAIYAGATFSPELARTTTLLSPLINGIATITLSILVDPTSARLVDQAGKGERSIEDVETMTFWLAVGTVAGTIISQLVFVPAAWAISAGAHLLDKAL
jgi:hypothetical protein